jgi:aminoglycoside N3'-acetyltransferase|tara:strand:+ start:207 stop:1004 length:798 start_codon:yes stop_codon:yes gene_type:complete
VFENNLNINGPVIVHSDIFQTMHLLEQKVNIKTNPNLILKEHFEKLENAFGKDNLCFPSFNYDFTKDGIYSVIKSESQVGALSNYILNEKILTRTHVPVFSFLYGKNFCGDYENSPFQENSIFSETYDNDGIILFYGAGINSCTYLHFVESQYGPPQYRYDKKFQGTIEINENEIKETYVNFHVRPYGLGLDYNWIFLYEILEKANAIKFLHTNVFYVKARDLSELWSSQILKDSISILSNECKIIVKEKLNKLNRRFNIKDFER